jgi:hypothetical protein
VRRVSGARCVWGWRWAGAGARAGCGGRGRGFWGTCWDWSCGKRSVEGVEIWLGVLRDVVQVTFIAEVLRRKSSQHELGPINRSFHSVSPPLPPQCLSTRRKHDTCVEVAYTRTPAAILVLLRRTASNAYSMRRARATRGATMG